MVVTLTKLTSELADNIELYDMSKEEGDEASLMQIERDTAKLAAEIEKLEFLRMFNNPADPLNCFLDIQAGAVAKIGLGLQDKLWLGNLDAQRDWSSSCGS